MNTMVKSFAAVMIVSVKDALGNQNFNMLGAQRSQICLLVYKIHSFNTSNT